MVSRTQKVIAGWAIGTIVGGIAGAIIGRRPPFTLNPPDEVTPLDLADQALAAGAGAVVGEIVGIAVALAV